MKCSKCGGELEYVKNWDDHKPASAANEYYTIAFSMLRGGRVEQLTLYVCGKCYSETKLATMGE